MRRLPLALLLAASLTAQTTPRQLHRFLDPSLQSPDLVNYQLRRYLRAKVPKLAVPPSARQWTKDSQTLRRRILDEVVFQGWPREWVDSPLRVEDAGLIPTGPGYRLRKLRYEIVPGFWSSALLYEPDPLPAKAPAILNVNGHVGAPGKAVEYKQKRCINYARRGILALNLEWLSYGELSGAENAHWFGAHLDLAGANAVGLFYLAMRKGLDYLWDHPNADRARLGVTGLSGGGWQTIVLSSLDDRVAVAVPVAGYASSVSRLERPGDIGDIEQNPTDLLTIADYPHLTAMRAPRPTLLVYNAEDDCCFRAPLVKPYIFDHVRPFFALYQHPDYLAWHENLDPADHNYQLDNRRQSYRFFTTHFGLPVTEAEIPVDAEVKSPEDLTVGLPKDNLTILGLARKLAARSRPGTDLARTVRYQPVAVAEAWALGNSKSKGLETRSWRFDFSNGLSATAVWFQALAASGSAPATIVLNDSGKKASAAEVSDRINRGDQVLTVDLLFTGDAAPQNPGPYAYAQMIASAGDRPLGLEAAQLIALARWLAAPKVRLETTGPRSHVIARVAAQLEPTLFSELAAHSGLPSLRHLLDTPVEYRSAPDLFCFGLVGSM
jgi:dienelactone hydrolase